MAQFSKLKLMEIANRVPLFKALTAYEKQQVIAMPDLVRVIKKHCKFIVFGEHDDSFYIVLSGTASVYQQDHKIATIEGGQFVGEVGFICGEARTASVVADSDLVTFCIDRKRFAQLPLVLRDKVKDRLINGLVQRVEHMNQHLAQLDQTISDFRAGKILPSEAVEEITVEQLAEQAEQPITPVLPLLPEQATEGVEPVSNPKRRSPWR